MQKWVDFSLPVGHYATTRKERASFVAPSLQDLRKLFYNPTSGQSVSDAEYQALLAAQGSGANASVIIPGPWITPALNADFAGSLVRYRKEMGGVRLQMILNRAGGSVDDRVFSLPVGYRPSNFTGVAHYFTTIQVGVGFTYISIDSDDGEVHSLQGAGSANNQVDVHFV